jgi:hypothetical protein
MMFRLIRNLSGSSPMMGRIFLSTGLYFFFCVTNRGTKSLGDDVEGFEDEGDGWGKDGRGGAVAENRVE